MLTLLVLMSIAAISLSAAAPSTSDESYANIKKDNADEHPLAESEQPSFLVRNGRFLAQRVQAASTCDVFPRLCLAKASPGPDCCKNQCVNVMTDKLNCGKCGKRCKYSDMCCQGECVNPSNDERHCGRCNKKCRNGGSCEYGLCSYA
ncbi:stigma-specific STIG1-like protein 1 [Corylus avellana]|uniref:stigma-specific STIG1-like protein 1 n=1 Tax=Corylus avellana TaxID=13451 RepID=UPI001E1F9038|nr:stigma-specific STIG1-like protein 1 [Corylus avellana]